MSDVAVQCPFCGIASRENLFDMRTVGGFEKDEFTFNDGLIIYSTLKCANPVCKKQSLWIAYYDAKKELIVKELVPEPSEKNFEHIPKRIKKDYDTACQDLDSDPNASATMARRCLHLMIEDFYKIKETNLHKAIQELGSRNEPQKVLDALHKLRKLGNLGAHGDPDSLSSDVTRDEAKQMIQLLELLFHHWYIASEEKNKILHKIAAFAPQRPDGTTL